MGLAALVLPGYKLLFTPSLPLCLWLVVGLESGGSVPKVPKRRPYVTEMVSAWALA